MSTLDLKQLMAMPEVTIRISIADLREVVRMMFRDEQLRTQAAIEESREIATLTKDEVCKMLGVSRNTLWRWAKEGYLIPEKVGIKVVYRRSEIERLLNMKRNYQ